MGYRDSFALPQEVETLVSDRAFAAGSLAEVLLTRGAETPDAPAYCFLIDGVEEGPRLNYAELDRQARMIAATLQDLAGPGDRALLLFAPGLAFISVFFGCQYAGVVPVPLYPPRPDRLAQSWEMLGRIAADCSPRVILTDRIVAPFVPTGGTIAALTGIAAIVTDAIDPGAARRWHEPRRDGDDLALLQYTSGSTAEPKGVMVSHRNMMDNQRMILTVTRNDHDHHANALGHRLIAERLETLRRRHREVLGPR